MSSKTQTKTLQILSKISKNGSTANEAINLIYKADIKSGLLRADWRYYLQLNKLLAPMERQGLVQQTGLKKVNGRDEKVWQITKLGNEMLANFELDTAA